MTAISLGKKEKKKAELANRKMIAEMLRIFADILERKSTKLDEGFCVSKDWLFEELDYIDASISWPPPAKVPTGWAVIEVEKLRFKYKDKT